MDAAPASPWRLPWILYAALTVATGAFISRTVLREAEQTYLLFRWADRNRTGG